MEKDMIFIYAQAAKCRPPGEADQQSSLLPHSAACL